MGVEVTGFQVGVSVCRGYRSSGRGVGYRSSGGVSEER